MKTMMRYLISRFKAILMLITILNFINSYIPGMNYKVSKLFNHAIFEFLIILFLNFVIIKSHMSQMKV